MTASEFTLRETSTNFLSYFNQNQSDSLFYSRSADGLTGNAAENLDQSELGESQLKSLIDDSMPLYQAEPFPKKADVVVIGGGIIGVATSYFLAQRGMSVVLCEKGRLAAEQSGRNWGWVRQQGRAEAELPMMMRSNAIWREWQQSLGFDTGFEIGGCLYMAKSTKELDENEAWLDIAKSHELETQILNQAALQKVLHDDCSNWAGALYTPSDGRAEPSRAVPAIAAASTKLGAVVIEKCAVRGVETSAGEISHVVTERGSIKTSQVVCAAGAWASLWCGALNVPLPQLKVKGTVGRLAPFKEIIRGTAWAPDIAIRRRQDGGYTVAPGSALEHAIVPATFRYARKFLPAFIQEHGAARVRLNRDFFRELSQTKRWPLDQQSPFERQRVLHPEPSKKILGEMRTALRRDFPTLGEVPFVETWAGMIDVTPDLIPVISKVEQVPGLIIATGFSGHGFGLGPGAGESIADLITGRSSNINMRPFRWSRFFDGSPLVLGPTV